MALYALWSCGCSVVTHTLTKQTHFQSFQACSSKEAIEEDRRASKRESLSP